MVIHNELEELLHGGTEKRVDCMGTVLTLQEAVEIIRQMAEELDREAFHDQAERIGGLVEDIADLVFDVRAYLEDR